LCYQFPYFIYRHPNHLDPILSFFQEAAKHKRATPARKHLSPARVGGASFASCSIVRVKFACRYDSINTLSRVLFFCRYSTTFRVAFQIRSIQRVGVKVLQTHSAADWKSAPQQGENTLKRVVRDQPIRFIGFSPR
jgi:hypothetical protein